MATQDQRVHASSAAVAASGSGTLVEYEEFIEAQLRKTRSHVRGVDLAGTLLTLVTGTLAFFFVAGIVDHWFVPGGLGFWGRLALLCLYLVGVGVYLVRQVLPLVIRRINPLYAAQTIERSRPSLKNAIVNFLLFREDHAGMPQVVYEAIEEQAAVNLAKVHVESAVDRSKLIRIGYVLVAVLVICAVYTLFSPKDLFRTAGRVAMPWAGIDPPTSTTIQEIEPGDLQTFRGQQVNVKARIDGLADGDKARVVYSTDDGQVIDRAVDMSLPADGYKHAALLPSGDGTLQQSLTYRVEAGDAVSRAFRVVVSAAPAIVVREVEYKYPPYTGLVSQRVADQGDLKAIEGTEITIRALANEPIVSAFIDFDCDDKLDQRMHADKEEAHATFTAALKPDRSGPAYQRYQLLFKNERGEQNPQPVRHQIEVTRDLAPEVQVVAPKDEEVDVPLDGSVELEIAANDPDFALRSLRLGARVGDKGVVEKVLLDEVWRGQCVKKFRFEPAQLGLREGDLVEYVATAEDNKTPQANRVETAPRRLRVVSAENRAPRGDKTAKGNQRGQGQQPPRAGDKGDDNSQRPPAGDAENQKDRKPDARVADRRADQSEKPPDAKQDGSQEPSEEPQAAERSPSEPQEGSREGEAQGSNKGSGQTQGERGDDGSRAADQSVPTDGSNDREAIERILEHRKDEDRAESRQDGQQSPRERGDGQDQAEQEKTEPQSSDANDDASQQGGEKAGSKGGSQTRGQEGAQQNHEQSGQQGGRDSQPGADRRPEAAGSKQQARDSGDREQSSDKSGESSKTKQPGASAKDSSERSAESKGSEPRRSDDKAGDDKARDNKAGDGSAHEGKGDQGDNAGSEKPTEASDAKNGKPGGKSSQQEKGAQGGSDGSKSDKNGEEKSADRQSEEGRKQGDQARKPEQASRENRDKQDSAGADKRGAADEGKSDPTSKGTEKPVDKSADNAAENGDKQSGGGEKSRDKSDSSAEGDRQQKSDQAGSQQDGQQGRGQSNKQNRPSPEPQGANQPRAKSPDSSPNQDDRPNPSGAQSPSTSEKQSDSEGRDDGDRSGGGKQGGGQKAKKPGQGGAGQSTPSDDGAGRAEEPGEGETSPGQRGDRPSGEKSSTSGSQPGKGSSSANSKDGSAPSADDAKPDDSPPSGRGQQDDALRPGHNVRPGAPGSQFSNQPTGGKPGANQSADLPWRPGQEVADKANLEYARKATDLAIAHLKDELKKDQPDPQLLERLGWSKADLENFVRRWEQMRASAQTAGAKGTAARRDLDEALRSLGLRPRATSLNSNAARDDKSQGYKESRRTSPPPEYAEQYKAYTQGTAKGAR